MPEKVEQVSRFCTNSVSGYITLLEVFYSNAHLFKYEDQDINVISS